jgi:hypothetical protein
MLTADYSACLFKGDQSWQKYIKIMRENLCHMNSPRGKSFETGIVPDVMHSHPLSSVLLSYYGLLTREPFSYSVVWVGIVPEPVGEVHNKFST